MFEGDPSRRYPAKIATLAKFRGLLSIIFALGIGVVVGLLASSGIPCRKHVRGVRSVERYVRKTVATQVSTGGLGEAQTASLAGAQKAVPYPIIMPMRTRGDIIAMLEKEKLKVGAELGVQYGHFAEHALSQWPSCERYYLVDVWANQANYTDQANANDAEQDRIFKKAQEILKPWEAKTIFLRMYTDDAAAQIPDGSLDYVYVDARHDYCGVKADIANYWPKLRSGGLMAGHDYYTNADVKRRTPDQDWGLCGNGERNDGAVKAAVDEFAISHGLILSVVYDETWPSWIVRKP